MSTDTDKETIARLERDLDRAASILTGSSGILRSWGTFGGERKRVWKVVVDGRQVSMWTKRRWAWFALREARADQRRSRPDRGAAENGQ